MKRKNYILLLAAGAMLAAGCSDEVVSSSDNQALTFEVVAEQATRAEHVYCNSYLMPEFLLWARQDNGNPYIDGETCSRQEETNRYNLPETRYVPKNDMYLEFYAVYNTGKATGDANSEGFHYTHAGAANGGNEKYIIFKPDTEAQNQKDLLYAASRWHSKEISSGIIALNFRHLLSQVVFKAQVQNEHLHVEIDEIKLCNIKSTGKWTPSSNGLDQFTMGNLYGHTTETPGSQEGANAPSYADNEIGSWTSSGTAEYTTGLLQETYGWWTTSNNGKELVWDDDNDEDNDGPIQVPYGDVKNLTEEVNTVDGHIANTSYKHSFLLLPQETPAWNTEAYKTPTAAGQTGAYMLVKCKIWNVSDPSLGVIRDLEMLNRDVPLWFFNEDDGSESTRYIAIPVDVNWQSGRKYTYKLIFGQKTYGGYDPETGNKVLVPIQVKVTVDDFVKVTPDNEVTM
ncbi:MAG: fimbrillin family protein [Paludibacteraceae bacterium]